MTTQMLYPGKETKCPLDRKLGAPRSCGNFGGKENLFPLPHARTCFNIRLLLRIGFDIQHTRKTVRSSVDWDI
jgi:hypothetical protein